MVFQQRKSIILAILEKMGGSVTAIQMQKYLFLYAKSGGEKLYDFVPYRYGCFSFQANKDLLSLANDQFVIIEKDNTKEVSYRLCHQMNTFATLDMFTQETISKLIHNFGQMSQSELVAYTYKNWPFTAINSIIKENLLNSEDLERVRLQKDRYVCEDPALLTIGYEGFSLEVFMRQLITNDVKVLCDVRKNAISRKYGFSKSTLCKACDGMNIRYVHVPELGIESNLRQRLSCQQDYDNLFAKYEETTLKSGEAYLKFIKDMISSEGRVCLMCFEKDPRQCHRTRIARALMSLPGADWKFTEILL